MRTSSRQALCTSLPCPEPLALSSALCICHLAKMQYVQSDTKTGSSIRLKNKILAVFWQMFCMSQGGPTGPHILGLKWKSRNGNGFPSNSAHQPVGFEKGGRESKGMRAGRQGGGRGRSASGRIKALSWPRGASGPWALRRRREASDIWAREGRGREENEQGGAGTTDGWAWSGPDGVASITWLSLALKF